MWHERPWPVTSSKWSLSLDHLAGFDFVAGWGDAMISTLDGGNVNVSVSVASGDSDMVQHLLRLIENV